MLFMETERQGKVSTQTVGRSRGRVGVRVRLVRQVELLDHNALDRVDEVRRLERHVNVQRLDTFGKPSKPI